jgi:hypothetical protein
MAARRHGLPATILLAVEGHGFAVSLSASQSTYFLASSRAASDEAKIAPE